MIGEANFSDHGANRLGASALMQGLADGYFILPYTIGNFLAGVRPDGVGTDHAGVPGGGGRGGTTASQRLLGVARPAHRHVVPPRARATSCGTTAAWRGTAQGLATALRKIPALREEFWQDVTRARDAAPS